jgi:transposase
MFSSPFLPLPAGLQIATTTLWNDLLVVQVVSTNMKSCCPLCFCLAQRRHSQYTRVVADLPCAGFRVQLILHVRRFFCDHADCIRKIFTERIPAFVLPWARLTVRLCEALQSVGLATCGELGTRLAERLAIQRSPTTILRRIMVLPTAAVEHVWELGRDDFSFRRGRKFGTILVDMQSHQTIDLLPDRKKETAAAWMSAHPEIDAGRVGIAAATMLLRQPVVLPKLSSVQIGSICSKTLVRLWRQSWHVIWPLIGPVRLRSSQPDLSPRRDRDSHRN